MADSGSEPRGGGLDTFRGEGDPVSPQRWLARYERHFERTPKMRQDADQKRLDPESDEYQKLKILNCMSFLRGAALRWAESGALDDINEWKRFEALFLQRFDQSITLARALREIHDVRWRKGQSVYEMMDLMRTLVQRCEGDVDDSILGGAFVDALPAAVRIPVAAEFRKDDSDLDALCAAAKAAIDAISRVDGDVVFDEGNAAVGLTAARSTGRQRQTGGAGVSPDELALVARMTGLSLEAVKARAGKGVCLGCGKRSHKWKRCYKLFPAENPRFRQDLTPGGGVGAVGNGGGYPPGPRGRGRGGGGGYGGAPGQPRSCFICGAPDHMMRECADLVEMRRLLQQQRSRGNPGGPGTADRGVAAIEGGGPKDHFPNATG